MGVDVIREASVNEEVTPVGIREFDCGSKCGEIALAHL
jgi:hypothetical protein